MCIYTYLCNRLHLIKSCLCCFLDMHLYSNSLSTIATICLLIKSELFLACFSCSNSFILSQSSPGSDDKNIVYTPEAMIGGDFYNSIRVLSRVGFLPTAFRLKSISSAKSYITFV